MEKMKVPFGTINIPERSRELIKECLDSTRISSGQYVRELEERFADLHGVKEAIAVSSGTDADIIALAVLHDYGANRGDEVIVPALSFVATGNAVYHAGFKPVFVDVEMDTLNIDTSQIENSITEKTRAVMPVHLMGKPADMDTINTIAEKYDLLVVEDAAEAHGALYRGRPVGGLGDIGAFSLYIAHIITTGEGGIITTDNEEYGEILRSLRAHGRGCSCKVCILSSEDLFCQKRFSGPEGEDVRFTFGRIGYSSKMNEMEAAIGLGNMDHYQDILAKRYSNLKYLMDRFDRFSPYLAAFKEEDHEKIGPHAFPIIVTDNASFTRVQLTGYLEDSGIQTRTLFASMPTQCPSFAHLGYRQGQFPVSEYLGSNGIHIGIHQDLGIEEMEYVIQVLSEFLTIHQD